MVTFCMEDIGERGGAVYPWNLKRSATCVGRSQVVLCAAADRLILSAKGISVVFIHLFSVGL